VYNACFDNGGKRFRRVMISSRSAAKVLVNA
jgi:hypothetical protein